MTEDEAGDFHDVHLHHLQSQGNIYTLSKIIAPSRKDVKDDRKERDVFILASTLNRRSFTLQCRGSSSNTPRIISKEIHFTYIPSGAEIISIDAFRREDLKDYVVGITIIIKSPTSSENATNSGGQFFNIYSDDIPLEDTLAHNCQSLELDFIPYQLSHAPVKGPQGSIVWLLSGSDSQIHPYSYESEGQVYSKIPLSACFPELEEEKDTSLSIVQWLDIIYYETESDMYRLCATGREDGRLKVTRFNLKSSTLEALWIHEAMEDPICSLKFFQSTLHCPTPKILEGFPHSNDTKEWNLAVAYALSEAKVFHDINQNGLEDFETLKNSHNFDVPTSVLIADVNFDGKPEILISTYGQVILCYGNMVPNGLDYIDLSGDGIRDLVVMTTKGLHILQLDRTIVMRTLKKRLNSLLEGSCDEVGQMNLELHCLLGCQSRGLLRTHAMSGSSPSTTTENVVKGNPSQYVKLNVGGSLHYTTIGTLTKHDNMLGAMFSGRMEVLTDAEGWILIDRCGKHFSSILNFLRDGNVSLPESRRELSEMHAEAKYFCIDDLADACEKRLKTFSEEPTDLVPICRVPLITSQKEEQALITANFMRPAVKLLINRHNNKYSYTGASDDNLLKNIELFDKMSLRFSNRVLFIKDVISSNEICCWSFYGHGKKNCGEARIYEETLNCLLYENRTGPDQELMQATSTRGAVASYTSDDEDDRNRPIPQPQASSSERSGLARLRSNKNN
ncbi:BACURD [Lepeophtheirus salmonis]|uniref:BACURD n=2 Tax=Lepeophtheirus salmonis TaxID=72036 RepID=A0A7R8D613_LEPSM|nr:BACURD [Lepeophtheirus salmonis]CAF3012855.1 BACURD [Lepeophtheirus salmonis]